MTIKQFEAQVKKILKNKLDSITYGYKFKDGKRSLRDIYVHYFISNVHKCELAWTFEEMIKKLNEIEVF